jgi:hypothetical protein
VKLHVPPVPGFATVGKYAYWTFSFAVNEGREEMVEAVKVVGVQF